MIISTDIDTDVLGARGQVALYFHNYWTMYYSWCIVDAGSNPIFILPVDTIKILQSYKAQGCDIILSKYGNLKIKKNEFKPYFP